MNLLYSLMNLLSGLFGIALILLGGWLWPSGITDMTLSSIQSILLVKAALTLVLSVYGTHHFIRSL